MKPNSQATVVLNSFQINAFRKMETINLNDLGHFNLIVGKNNSGKTSILEAIGVGLAMGDKREILSIARKRDSRSNVVFAGHSYLADIVSWMFPAPDSSFWDAEFSGAIDLEFSANGADYKSAMSCRRIFLMQDENPPGHQYKDQTEPLRGIEITTRICERLPLEQDFQEITSDQFSLGKRSIERETMTGRRSQVRAFPFEYISPYSHRNSNSSENFVRRLNEDVEKSDLIDLLQSIDNEIVNVTYEPFLGSHSSRGGRAVVETSSNKYIPLSVMGDGVRRIFELAFALHFSRNGVLLIDEIEAGFHVGMLGKVYRWLTEKARQNKVQIIASTHSIEAIQAMVEATPKSPKLESLRAFSIGLDRSFGKVRHYYGDELQSLISDNGLDIR